jgi:hypothetical protein
VPEKYGIIFRISIGTCSLSDEDTSRVSNLKRSFGSEPVSEQFIWPIVYIEEVGHFYEIHCTIILDRWFQQNVHFRFS